MTTGRHNKNTLDFSVVEEAIEGLLAYNEKPTISKIKKHLKISDDSLDQIIGYYLYMWEQRHTTTHLDDINLSTTVEAGDESGMAETHQNADKVLVERTLQLEESLSMMRATIDATADSIMIISKEGKFVGYNQKFVKLFNFTPEILNSNDETVALNYALGQIENPQELANLVTQKYKHPISGNCGEMTFKNGAIVERYYQPQIVNDEVIGHVWSLRDITEHKRLEKELLHKVTHDGLTNLPNRSLILDRISQAMAYASRTKEQFSVFFLDLDNFKLTNDTLGHNVGDTLLKLVSHRLSKQVRTGDTIGRLGGDEFFMVSNFFKGKDSAFLMSNRLLDVFSKPFKVSDQLISITASIGGCLYPYDGIEAEVLMKNADIAMYHAKSCGKNTFRFYQDGMNERLEKRLWIGNRLRSSIEQQKMFLVYQPIYDAQSHKIVSVEALIRFDFLQALKVGVDDVINVAEESGLISTIGDWVVNRGCSELYELGGDFKLAINISGIQMRDNKFVEKMTRLIKQSKLAPERLEFELTETVLMSSLEKNLEMLHQLKALGIHLSLDDFGTGYSSLSYLHQFPMSKLKIDKSFVSQIKSVNSKSSLIEAIISMAKCFDMKVVAEGVETKMQYQHLKKLGCDQIQGYYFSKPVPINKLKALIINTNGLK